VAASLAGWKSYLANPEPTLPFIKEFNKDYDLELGALAATAEKPLVLGKDNTDPNKIGALSPDRMKQLHDQMREVGVLTKDVDFKAAIEPRFVEAVQRA
jgi:NitT/TauT family transport system substrate-binding protein